MKSVDQDFFNQMTHHARPDHGVRRIMPAFVASLNFAVPMMLGRRRNGSSRASTTGRLAAAVSRDADGEVVLTLGARRAWVDANAPSRWADGHQALDFTIVAVSILG